MNMRDKDFVTSDKKSKVGNGGRNIWYALKMCETIYRNIIQ